MNIVIWESVVENRTLLTVTDVLTSWGHHALKSLNPSLHYILAKLFVNLHIIFESMDGTLCSYHLNETSFAGFIQSLEFLKKSWNLSSNFLDLEKVWKIEMKSTKIQCFFSKLQQMLYKWIFFHFCQILFNLVHMFAAHPEKSFVPALWNRWSIEFLTTLSLGKKNFFWKKSGKSLEFWIQKSVRTLYFFLRILPKEIWIVWVYFFFGHVIGIRGLTN